MLRRTVVGSGLVALVAACPADDRNFSGASTTGNATAGSDTTSDSTASSMGPESQSDSASSDSMGTSGDNDTPKLDLAVPDVANETEGQGGCDKVDFLFAIDNSGSMDEDQASLIAAFPGFIAAIRDNVEGQDYHVMVVDSDANPVEQYCEGDEPGFCGPTGLCDPFECGSWDSLGLHICDETLGAGVRSPYGGAASNVDCGLPEDRRYLVEGDPNLDNTFGCLAQVGVTGSRQERPISALLAALGPELQAEGSCNEGFLRDDAILVVTIVSDDPSTDTVDDAQLGVADPMAWRDQLVALKNGQEDAIVMVGIVPMGSPLQDLCIDNEPHHPFRRFVESFGDKGLLGSLCDADYTPVFTEAVGLIDQTCDDFQPEG